MPDLATIQRIDIVATASGVAETAAKLDALGRSHQGVAAASQQSERATISLEKRVESIQRRYDEHYRATQELAKVERDLDRARGQGLISLERQGELLERARARFGQHGAAMNDNAVAASRFSQATGLAGHQVQNLGYQLNDIAGGLASGQSPFMILAQQGGQVQQVLSSSSAGVGGALAGIGSYLVGLISPATAAAAALLAIGATGVVGLVRYNDEAEALRRSLLGLGASTGATVDGLARIATQAASSGKVTESMARDITAALASTGKIGVENFEGIITKTKDFAAVIGVDAKEATSQLAAAFADPVKGADELNGKLGFLSDRIRQNIVDLVQANDHYGAQRSLMDALGPSISDAANRTTVLGRAWQFVASAASGAASAMANALRAASTQETYQKLISQRQGIVDGPTGKTERGKAAAGYLDAQIESMSEQIRREGQAASNVAREATARQTSIAAGEIARALDPLNAKFDELRQKRDKLGAALANPGDLANVDQVKTAYDAYDRAVSSLTDSQGKLISSTELLRQKDALALEAKNATTDADKAAIAAKQKTLDLVGEVIGKSEAERRATQASALAMAGASKSAGSAASDTADAFDNALAKSRDSIEELKLQQDQAGKTSVEVYRLTEANRLRRAAASAGRADEDGITETILKQADAYAVQRKATEDAIEANRRLKESFDAIGSSFKSFAEELLTGSGGIDAALKGLGKSFLSSSLDALISGKGSLAGISGLAPQEKNGQGGLLGLLTGGNLKPLQDAVSKGTASGSAVGFEAGFHRAAGNDSGGGFLSGLGIDGKQLAGGLVSIAGLAGTFGVKPKPAPAPEPEQQKEAA